MAPAPSHSALHLSHRTIVRRVCAAHRGVAIPVEAVLQAEGQYATRNVRFYRCGQPNAMRCILDNSLCQDGLDDFKCIEREESTGSAR